MTPFSLLPWWLKLLAFGAAVAAVLAAIGAYNHHQREIGRDEVRAEWDAAKVAQQAADLRQSKANALETARRLAAQQANQEKQNAELALARAAADRNRLDAERVRKQSSAAADLWSHTLRNSPTSADLAAAADTINLLTLVRGRLDQHAGELASYADAARAAGLKCERDYSALTVKP